jgi:predicted RNase H-like HicB family nuclease
VNAQLVVVRCHQEPDGWWAESADLPGYSAAAPTREELERRVIDGVLFHFGEVEHPPLAIMFVSNDQGGGTLTARDLATATSTNTVATSDLVAV